MKLFLITIVTMLSQLVLVGTAAETTPDVTFRASIERETGPRIKQVMQENWEKVWIWQNNFNERDRKEHVLWWMGMVTVFDNLVSRCPDNSEVAYWVGACLRSCPYPRDAGVNSLRKKMAEHLMALFRLDNPEVTGGILDALGVVCGAAKLEDAFGHRIDHFQPFRLIPISPVDDDSVIVWRYVLTEVLKITESKAVPDSVLSGLITVLSGCPFRDDVSWRLLLDRVSDLVVNAGPVGINHHPPRLMVLLGVTPRVGPKVLSAVVSLWKLGFKADYMSEFACSHPEARDLLALIMQDSIQSSPDSWNDQTCDLLGRAVPASPGARQKVFSAVMKVLEQTGVYYEQGIWRNLPRKVSLQIAGYRDMVKPELVPKLIKLAKSLDEDRAHAACHLLWAILALGSDRSQLAQLSSELVEVARPSQNRAMKMIDPRSRLLIMLGVIPPTKISPATIELLRQDLSQPVLPEQGMRIAVPPGVRIASVGQSDMNLIGEWSWWWRSSDKPEVLMREVMGGDVLSWIRARSSQSSTYWWIFLEYALEMSPQIHSEMTVEPLYLEKALVSVDALESLLMFHPQDPKVLAVFSQFWKKSTPVDRERLLAFITRCYLQGDPRFPVSLGKAEGLRGLYDEFNDKGRMPGDNQRSPLECSLPYWLHHAKILISLFQDTPAACKVLQQWIDGPARGHELLAAIFLAAEAGDHPLIRQWLNMSEKDAALRDIVVWVLESAKCGKAAVMPKGEWMPAYRKLGGLGKGYFIQCLLKNAGAISSRADDFRNSLSIPTWDEDDAWLHDQSMMIAVADVLEWKRRGLKSMVKLVPAGKP